MATHKFRRTNTVNINLTFTGVDLTGATVFFTMKLDFDNDATDAAALIKKDVTSHIDAVNGKTRITLTPADTIIPANTYGYDIKLKKAGGEATTVEVGEIEVEGVYGNRG